MIRHVVMWRLKPEAKLAGSIEQREPIERALEALRAGVPGLRRLELGVDQAHGPDAADLLLFGEFDSWEALRGYERHPLHDQLRGLIGPIRVERRVLDYEV